MSLTNPHSQPHGHSVPCIQDNMSWSFFSVILCFRVRPQVCSLLDATHLICIQVQLHWHLFQILLGQVYIEGQQRPLTNVMEPGAKGSGPQQPPIQLMPNTLSSALAASLALFPGSNLFCSAETWFRDTLNHTGVGSIFGFGVGMSWVTRGPASHWLS